MNNNDIMATLPVENLSYSQLRKFVTNPKQWLDTYVLGNWNITTSVSMVAGSAFHKAMAEYMLGSPIDKAIEMGMEYINEIDESTIDFGKTGSMEKIVSMFTSGINFFVEEQPFLGKVLDTEVSHTAPVVHNGVQYPLPVKAVTDVVCDIDGEIHLADWKLVSRFSDKTVERGDYVLQAMFNYYTIKQQFGTPKTFTFYEIKKTKNKDNSPQVEAYRIEYDFDRFPQYELAFMKMYGMFIRLTSSNDFVAMPNPWDQIGDDAQQSWDSLVDETMDFTVPRPDSFKVLVPKDTTRIDEALYEEKTLPHQKIAAKCQEFGCPLKFKQAYTGPNVTMYSFVPGRGVRMSKLSSLEPDVALALSAHSVRILAPIPGTNMVGFEVSNDKNRTVVKFDDTAKKSNTFLIPVGVDVYGDTKYVDLEKAPHILVAGATGSGKSVFLESAIRAIFDQNPKKVEMYLIDPKRTEFHNWRQKAKHITETRDTVKLLDGLIDKMESRFVLLEKESVRDIAGYEEKTGKTLRRIVIIIDEWADLMMSGKIVKNLSTESKVYSSPEEYVVRLAQKGRAVGIHVILATQRPSVDVVTGLVKAQFPVRVSFMVATQVDSKVILDQGGAEQLLGAGDMLLSDPSQKGLQRLQGFYIKS